MRRKTRHLATLLLTALLLAACGQDDAVLQSPTDNVEGTYTFTATLCRDMQGDNPATRATYGTDDTPSRCLAQAVWTEDGTTNASAIVESTATTDGSYTFAFSLYPNYSYTFLFWADNATTEVTDLTAVPYTAGSVAFAGQASPTESGETAVTLSYAVAKVTLQSSTNVPLTLSQDVTLTVTNCVTQYNVLSGTGTAQESTYTWQSVGSTLPTDNAALACYILPAPNATHDVSIGMHLLSQTVSNVPLAANTSNVLRSDYSESSANWGWGASANEYIEAKFRSYFYDGDTPKGLFVEDDRFYAITSYTEETLLADFRSIMRDDSFMLPEATVDESYPDDWTETEPIYISTNIYIMNSWSLNYGNRYVIYDGTNHFHVYPPPIE